MGRRKGSKNKVSKKIIFVCSVCSLEWSDHKYKKGKRKFCSRSCSTKARSIGNTWGRLRRITPEYRKLMRSIMKGKRRPKIAESKRGSKNPNWRGGISPKNKRVRMSADFKEWRKKIFERDDYTCQDCGKRGGELHPDHIKQFAYFPELRFELSNGRTLCKKCHMKTPTWGFKNYKLPTEVK